MKLSGNTVLITGGATGIGFAMAEAFLQAGNEVIICGRRQGGSSTRRTASRSPCHGRATWRTRRIAGLLAEWTSANFKNLNVLVNNAGVQRDIDFTKGVDAFLSGESEIGDQPGGADRLVRAVHPPAHGKNEPAIVNVSSGLGFVPAARMPVYSATKAGLHAFSMALRHQLSQTRDQGLRGGSARRRYGIEPGRPGPGGNFKAGSHRPEEYTAAVMQGLEGDVLEIGYGMSERMFRASRDDLDERFQQMNRRW